MLQDVDVVLQFPPDASESAVLFYRSRIERLPGVLLRVRTMAPDRKLRPPAFKKRDPEREKERKRKEEEKRASCYAFHLSATYQG